MLVGILKSKMETNAERIKKLSAELAEQKDEVTRLSKCLEQEKEQYTKLHFFARLCNEEKEAAEISEIERSFPVYGSTSNTILWETAINEAIESGKSVVEVYHSLAGGHIPTTSTKKERSAQ